MATKPKNKLFLGSFVHSKLLDELEYLHNTVVCVDKSGTIVAVERECDEAKARSTLFPRLGWDVADVEVVSAADGQFFFPGFVGMFSLSFRESGRLGDAGGERAG